MDDADKPAILGGAPLRAAGPPVWPRQLPEVHAALAQAAGDGSWGRYHPEHCRRLADALAELHEIEHVALCCSGTAAVELALRGLKVAAGDEVLLAAYDFRGNFQNVLAIGATPVLVDILPHDWQLDVRQLERAVSERTRAVIVSHLHGGIADVETLVELARERGLAVIEDACQCPGARIGNRRAGTIGDVGVLSFGGSKLLTAGRGGAILTKRADVAQRITIHVERGNHAYPLSELQALVLLPQLVRLDADNTRRRWAVQWLAERLRKSSGLVPLPARSGAEPGYYKLGLQYDPAAFAGLDRDGFVDACRAEGIALDAGFRALHSIHSRRRFRAAGSLDVAASADRAAITLHHPVLLESEADLAEVVAAVERVRRHAAAIKLHVSDYRG